MDIKHKEWNYERKVILIHENNLWIVWFFALQIVMLHVQPNIVK